MGDQPSTLTSAEAERFRAYERQRHDALASSYIKFFSPVTAQAIGPMLDAVHLAPGAALLDDRVPWRQRRQSEEHAPSGSTCPLA